MFDRASHETPVVVGAMALVVAAAFAWVGARPPIVATPLIGYRATDRPDVVLVDHSSDDNPSCMRPLDSAAVETGETVVVVRRHERLHEFCTLAFDVAEGLGSGGTLAVCLSQPIGDRAVIDGGTGQPLRAWAPSPGSRNDARLVARTRMLDWSDHCIRPLTR